MTRRETLLRFSGITGVPFLLGACNMDTVRRAEANLGWRMKRPGTGVQFSGIPEVVKVIILATYPATPVQMQVAEKRARTTVANIAREQRKKVTYSSKKRPADKPKDKPVTVVSGTPSGSGSGGGSGIGGGASGSGGGVGGGGGQQTQVVQGNDAKVTADHLKATTGSATIAVSVPPDNRQVGKETVMLWNTQTERFVGNNVYDISSPPPKGQVAQWGSTTARYVGTGSGS